MIHFCRVTRKLLDRHDGPRYLLRGTTASLPVDCRVVLLGDDAKALTSILHLVTGCEVPDTGQIVTGRFRFSPVINSGGKAGISLAGGLNAIDNVRFFARLHGIHADHLVALVESVVPLGQFRHIPVGQCSGPIKRALEVALITAIPFDCYLIDHLQQIEGPLMWQLIYMARERHAGLVFTTNRVQKAAEFGQVGAVVRHGTIKVFPRVDLAVAYHELH